MEMLLGHSCFQLRKLFALFNLTRVRLWKWKSKFWILKSSMALSEQTINSEQRENLRPKASGSSLQMKTTSNCSSETCTQTFNTNTKLSMRVSTRCALCSQRWLLMTNMQELKQKSNSLQNSTEVSRLVYH